MNSTIKIVVIAALAGALAAYLVLLISAPHAASFGANNATTTATNPFQFKQGLVIGTTTQATKFTGLFGGVCDLIGTDVSQTASSSAVYDCSAPGVRPGYAVIAQLATSTLVTSTGFNWSISAAKASTTVNYITVTLDNRSASAKVPSATNVGSSTAFLIFTRQ